LECKPLVLRYFRSLTLLLLSSPQRLVPSLCSSTNETGGGITLGRRYVGQFPLEGYAFYAKRDEGFKDNLPTVFALKIRGGNFFNRFDSILNTRDGTEGDICCFFIAVGKPTSNQVISDVRKNWTGMRRRQAMRRGCPDKAHDCSRHPERSTQLAEDSAGGENAIALLSVLTTRRIRRKPQGEM